MTASRFDCVGERGWVFAQVPQRLNRVELRINRASQFAVVALIVVIGLVKHGPRMLMSFSDEQFAGGTPETSFPNVLFGRWLLFARILQIPNRLAFELVTFAVTLAILALFAGLLFRRLPRTPAIIAFAAVVLGQIGLILTSQFGHADQLLIAGAALIVLSSDKSWPLWLIGAVLVAIGNPGQAVVAATCLLLLTFVTGFEHLRSRSVVTLVTGSVWLVADTVITQANQADALDDWLAPSLFMSFVSGPFRLYGIYGALWLLIVFFLVGISRRQFLIGLAALVLLPLLFVLVTGDGTRVGVGVTSLALLALIVAAAPRVVTWFEDAIGPFPVTALVLVLILVPSMNLAGTDLVLPWDWIQHEVRFWVEVWQAR